MPVRIFVALLWKRHGPWPFAGILLLLGGLLLLLLVVPMLADRIAMQEAHLVSLRKAPPPDPTHTLLEQRFQAFATVLLQRDLLPDVARTLIQAGESNQVRIEEADYHPMSSPGGDYFAYHLSLPVRGSYPHIIAFSSRLLSEYPAAALTDIDLHRDSAGAGELDAKLEFIVFVRSQNGKP